MIGIIWMIGIIITIKSHKIIKSLILIAFIA